MPPRPRHLTRRRFLRWSALAVAASLAGVSTSGVLQAARLTIEPIELRLRGLSAPLRLAFLTDLHYGPYVDDRRVAGWVDATLDAQPDAIVLGGDVLDYQAPRGLAPLVAQLERLESPLGTFMVLGNHEHRHAGGAAAFASLARSAGVTTLRNAGVSLPGGLYLAGIDDLREGRPDVGAALRSRPAGAPMLLASHNPDVLPRLPAGVDLVLSGHTHGGQVVLPLVGAPVTSSRYGQRFLSGWVDAPVPAYVSRGLGVGVLPVRWNCPPELTLVTLLPG